MNSWSHCKKLLAVRLDNIGDLLMTQPAISALKTIDPQRSVSVLVSSVAAEAAQAMEGIDEVVVYDAPWLKATAPRTSRAEDFDIIERLKARSFDGAVIFTVYSQSPLPAAMLCFFAQIPRRLAYCHENPYQLLTDWIGDPDPKDGVRHEVTRQLDLVASIGCKPSSAQMSLDVPMEAIERLQQQLAARGLSADSPLIVIHPGATASSRRYPAEKFMKVACDLTGRGYQVVLTGTCQERRLVEGIRRAAPLCQTLAELNFIEFAALISLADVVVTNNTAPAHMAAAVGTPVVDLYALTNPQHTPWMVPCRVLFHDVPCKFCYKSVCPEGHHRCLEMVPWEDVSAMVEELLGEQKILVKRP